MYFAANTKKYLRLLRGENCENNIQKILNNRSYYGHLSLRNSGCFAGFR